MYPQASPAWDEDGHSDPPSTRSSNDPPEHMAHVRSRSTAHTHSPKRLSVFSGRSRSNTTTSTSSRRSPGSSMTSVDSSVPSQDERTTSSLGLREKPDRSSRSFLARGSRILRRQGSKINIVATLDEEDEMDREKSRDKPEHGNGNSNGMFGRRARHQDNHERLKSIISDPFDFHHLTHTNPSQFQSLDQTRENDLVTEFSVIRASQRPEAVLKGIRADDIHFQNFSADDLPLQTLGTATTVDEPAPMPSPPGSPAFSDSVSPKGHVRRESRAHENFSRPVSRYPRSSPATPPPPMAPEAPLEAEPAPRAIDEILGLASPKTYPEYLESTQATQLRFSPEPTETMTMRTGTSSMSSHSHYDLEDVPEEEEATRMWDSPPASIDYGHSRSTSQVSPLTAVEPSSIAASSGAPNGLSIFVAEELSRKFSEALGSPTLPVTLPNVSPKEETQFDATPPSVPSVQQFTYDDELYDSWDADIDYCYEHAAESTSNFDWSRTSLDEQQPQIGIACSDETWGLSAPKPRQLQPSPLSTSALPTPDLDSSTARSTVANSAATPSTTDYERDFIVRSTDDYFQPVSSSMLPSALGKHINQETLYEEYLTTDAESDRHFPFVAQGMMASENNPVSPRSSFSPISKCNSQESLMLSRAASIVRKHRSSVSTTSVPELIHSLSNSRELMPTDRLTAAEALAAGSTSRPPSSSHHRQTKSLETSFMLQGGGSSTSLVSADAASAPSPQIQVHDRAKSTSEMDPRFKAEPPLPPLPPKNPNRKKSRNPSYSLFPTAA